MSFLSDIAELAKAGYTPQDVKELLQLNKSDPVNEPKTEPQPTPTATGQTPPEPQPLPDPQSTEPVKSAASAPKASEQPEDVPDYEALYKAEQEKVKALQNKNNQADISNQNNTSQSNLVDLVREFC